MTDELSPSYDSTEMEGGSPPGVVVGRKVAPSFQLSDSEFKLFSYPADALLEYTLMIFVPNIFYSALYDQTSTVSEGATSVGIMNQLVEYFEALSVSVNVVMISGDLPFALSVAKERFNLPFRLLSDPSLVISNEFVGVVDIGDVVGRTDYDEIADENAKLIVPTPSPPRSPSTAARHRKTIVKSKVKRKMSSFGNSSGGLGSISQSKVEKAPSTPSYQSSTYRSSLGPNLGFILVNKQRDILKKSIFPLTRSAFTKCISLSINPLDWIRSTCMLVDDSQLYLKSLSKVIESCGMTVRCYSSAHAALDDLRKPDYIPSLLLIDIVMPDCDGLTLLNLIRGGDGRGDGIAEVSNVPVVMMSDLPVVGQVQLLASCREMGAFDVLKKPFNKERFLRLLQQRGLAQP
jgi:CheY-like chemotaxis protein